MNHKDSRAVFCTDGSNPLCKKDTAETTPVPLLLNQVHMVLEQCSSLLAPQRDRDMQ